MFTGLVEHVATISHVEPSTGTTEHIITLSNAAPILGDCHIGDSICVNGACLTVLEFDADTFKVGLAPETLTRTYLGNLVAGDKVNCERAMAAHTRFGGHVVQGHVDAVATIRAAVPDGASIRYTFAFPEDAAHLMPFVVEKGFITVDGASLTLTQIDDATLSFGIMLIAHSQSKLTLTDKKVGDPVNIETDCVGKYILGSESRIAGLVERVVDRRLAELGVLTQKSA
ncbi:Riboflavin synthase alpha chain [Vanrija albida]|uniref:Riboflavin synthase alpha chain n=1 Tax=Vanrija albida TaxID=181172 RepID=A0ABR3PRT4_9TREE